MNQKRPQLIALFDTEPADACGIDGCAIQPAPTAPTAPPTDGSTEQSWFATHDTTEPVVTSR